MKTNFSQEMKDILTNYSDDVVLEVKKILLEVAEESAEELKTAGEFNNRTGKYRKGWRVTENDGRTYYTAVAHNKTSAQITHLLEHGHATRLGGRTREFPHIEAVNEEAQKKVEQKIMEAIRNL